MTQAYESAVTGAARTELQPSLLPPSHAQNRASLVSPEDLFNSFTDLIDNGPHAADDKDSMAPSIQSRLHPEICPQPPPLPLPLPLVLPVSDLNIPPPPRCITEDAYGFVTSSQQDAFIDRLACEQDDIRDIRDSVLGFRFRLRAQRSQLRDARMEASEKDGSLLNMLRQYLHEHELPEHIRTKLDEASALHDRLGPMESSYDELEREYDAQEWNYTRRETSFIQTLTESAFVVEHPHRRTDNLPSANPTSFAVSGLKGLGDESWGEGSHVANTKDIFNASENWPHLSPADGFQMSRDEGFMSNGGGEAQNLLQDNKSLHLRKRHAWARKIKEIDDWLQDQVLQSPIAKIRAELCMRKLPLDDDAWWQQVKQNWMYKHDGLPVFHTGDSTISDIVMSPCTSTTTEQLGTGQGQVQTEKKDQMVRQESAPDLLKPLDMTNTEKSTCHGALSCPHSTERATSDAGFDVRSPHRFQRSENNNQSTPATPTQNGKERKSPVAPLLQSTSVNIGTRGEGAWNVHDPSRRALGTSGSQSNFSPVVSDSISLLVAPTDPIPQPSQVMLQHSPVHSLLSTPELPESLNHTQCRIKL
ncbi:predicted protein [Plenodomus lingam JN3]|uniref:Predicted protein n=1 Tax=Leptosphaeria maculans (strain JN3 / isolate v23.1.3 / race Av1-4-5-6-7-8) TaxID=985895 RepID=E5AD69_LEPMJ|nr:predicted protein [Plenodomus lingam JN3]CBY02421.1 predicted protein [Plenodomus lingam JN3]